MATEHDKPAERDIHHFRVIGTMTSGAVMASGILLILLLLVGVGNLWATYAVNKNSRNNICAAFESVVHAPSATIGSQTYKAQEKTWQNWLSFSNRLGCPK
jgi:hypothetical protein